MNPTPDQFRDIIESGGGVYLRSPPSAPAEDTYVISSPEDRASVTKFKKAGLKARVLIVLLLGVFYSCVRRDGKFFLHPENSL